MQPDVTYEMDEVVEYDEDTMTQLRIKSFVQYQDCMRLLSSDDDGEEIDELSQEEETEIPETATGSQSEKSVVDPPPEKKEPPEILIHCHFAETEPIYLPVADRTLGNIALNLSREAMRAFRDRIGASNKFQDIWT